ncbi:hypothetical protein ACLOJK_030533 [Asimina triloba]
MERPGMNSNLNPNPNPNANLARNVGRPHSEHLGVNKIGKNIRKSPLHHPNFANSKQHLPPPQQQQQQQQQPQPQVYNINKNDFRSIVQQLTGSPSHHDPLPPPAPVPRHSSNPPRPPSNRLQRIRPPPITTPIARPPIPPPMHPVAPIPDPFSPFLSRPGPFSPLMPGGDSVAAWATTAESPISAYMRYLQSSIFDSGSKQIPPGQPQPQGHPPSNGILPTPPIAAPTFPSPRGGSAPLSPALLPSPSSFLNLLSPRSSYPPLSPGFQFPSPFPQNFALSPLVPGSGILGPGPQFPPSPGIMFPSSPSGFFPSLSPRWRE